MIKDYFKTSGDAGCIMPVRTRKPFPPRVNPTTKKANFALAMGGFICFAMLYGTQPLLPQLAQHFVLSPTTASLSVTAGTSAMAFLLIPLSLIADRYGREMLMRCGLAGAALFSIASAFAPDFSQLVFCRVGVGACIAAFPAMALAYIGDEVPPESHGKAIGIYIAANALGGLSGRFLAGFVCELFNWQASLVVLGLLGLIAALVFWRLLPPARNFSPRSLKPSALFNDARALFSDPGLRCLFLVAFLNMGSFIGIYNYLSFRLSMAPYLLGPTAIGSIFMLYAVGSFSSTWAGRQVNRFGRQRLIFWMSLTMMTGIAITLAAPIVLIIAGLAIFTFGFFAIHSIASSWVGRRGGIRKGFASSLYLTSHYLGGSIIGSLAGWPWAHGGWPAVAASLLVYTGAVWLISLRLRSVTDS